MDREGLLTWERIDEVTRMCAREHPIYEQISGFSIALYILGYFECGDLLDAADVDDIEAGAILQTDFVAIGREELPPDYHICRSRDRYLMVIGDPLFPAHFAVVADMRSQRPYFSKLHFFGSGFDSLAELRTEFAGRNGGGLEEISFYRMKAPVPLERKAPSRIYVVNGEGDYTVLEY